MEFALDDYKARTDRLRYDDLDLRSAFAERPLDDATLRCLRYMHDVEFHTVCYLRDLLLTPAHQDPDMTTFLTFWNFEEYWHGEALGAVLAAHGEPHGLERVADVRGRLGWRDRLRPTITTLSSAAAGRAFIAVHMAWGAVNEWCTQAGYARVIAKADHPMLTALLRRIMRQEGRHIDFYASQAESRLQESTKARRVVRFALRHLWAPVGTGVMPDAESRFLVTHLFGDDDGATAAARIDRRIDRLPGQQGLALVSGARARYAA